MDGKLIDFGKEAEEDTRSLILELLDFVDDVVDELGSRKDLENVKRMLDEGTGADRQLAEFNKRQDLVDVVDFITRNTLKGIA